MVSFQASVALATIGVYLIIVLAIGYRGWQVGTLEIEDWMTAGRGLGVVVLLFTYAATVHSGFAFLGAGGFMYGTGIGMLLASALQLWLAGMIFWILGSRLWLLGKKYGYISPSDFIEDFYDSKPLGLLVSLVLIAFTFPYVAVQLTAGGIIFETATDGLISFEVGAAILLAAGVIYVWLGGLRAIAWTDVLQGVFMIFAIWISAVLIVFTAFNGPGAFFNEMTANFADHFTIPGPAGAWSPEFYITWVLATTPGLLMLPHLWLRYFAGRSPKTIKWVAAGGTSYLWLFYLGLPFIAIGGVKFFPDIANPDSIVPSMLFEFVPVWLASILVAGAIAAAMSTKDSQLHAVSMLITRDWYEEFTDGDVDERTETRFAQILVPILAIIAYVIAIQQFQIIFELLTTAASGAAQLLVMTVGALYWKRASKEGAIAGFVVGVLVTAGFRFGVIQMPEALSFGVFGGFWGLLVNAIVFVGVSLLTDPMPDENIERVQGYIDDAVNHRWSTAPSASDDD